ncbi:MAG: Nramp family divalent metal transporter [Tepidisphaeraceae bacterium]
MSITAPPPVVDRAVAPRPGSPKMPPWDVGELPDAPRLTARSWAMLIGPGLVMGGAAIGGGEWLAGPLTTARYGGAILWLSTVSILAQVVYNLEISRYTLYCGEPIFTGKFRLLPGPLFWLVIYLALDFGSVFPYLVANAATPLASVIVGEIPNLEKIYHVLGASLTGKDLLQVLKYVIFLGMLMPLVFGGKVYNSLKAIMGFKIGVVLGFLTLVAILFSSPATWADILSGFFKFGSVPVVSSAADAPGSIPQIDNFFVALWEGREMPHVDLSMVAVLGALAAISGCGGLTNTTISGYTRDQGWGMGRSVGAIPSVVGGRKLKLSHVGKVFPIDAESVGRFRRWFRFVLRDQLVVWMPACFIGIALPSMLSVQFLPRGTQASDWVAAGMTADALREAVGPTFGQYFWLMTLFCGFLVLAPSAVTTADGVLRRWVDVCWTAVPAVRKLQEHRIRIVYFVALCGYAAFGIVALAKWNPVTLLKWAGNIYNFALGFSCFHVLAVNTILLPREIRPNWFIRIGLVIGGTFFLALATITTMRSLKMI